MKTCSKCKETKETHDFNNHSRSKDGLKHMCKKCQCEYQQSLYKQKSEKVVSISEKFCKVCEETKPVSEFNKHKNTKDGLRYFCKLCQSKARKAYHAKTENKKRSNEQSVVYYENNKEKIKQRVQMNQGKRNERFTNKYRNDIQFKMMTKLHAQIGNLMSSNGRYTSKSIKCTKPFLINWMKFQFSPNMSWDNYGKWEIEHIIPFSAFDLTDKDQVDICCHWTNLQPMCKKQNKKKRDKIQLVYFMNSIINVHRFIQKYSPNNKKGYEYVKKRLNWLKQQEHLKFE